jgi:hypothetical protein
MSFTLLPPQQVAAMIHFAASEVKAISGLRPCTSLSHGLLMRHQVASLLAQLPNGGIRPSRSIGA